MARRERARGAGVGGVGAVGLAVALLVVWPGRGEAADPSVCAYASLGIEGATTTTVVSQGGCPALPPPAAGDPCPGGPEVRNRGPLLGTSRDVMVCVRGL